MPKKQLLSRLNILRGLFALQVVIGHVVQYETSFIHIWGRFMIISVAFFFFVSGFSLEYSFEQKPNYLKGFFRNKVLYLLCISILAYIFACILELVLPINYLFFQPGTNLFLTLYTTTNWYVYEQIFFYLIFLLTGLFISKKQVRLIVIFITTVFIMVISYFYLYEAYYASSLAFPLGIAYSMYYKETDSYVHSPKGYVSTIIFLLLGLSVFALSDSFLSMVVLRNCMCIGGLFLIVYISTKYDFTCKITKFLTKYSTEFYFFQFCLVLHINKFPISWPLRCLTTIIAVLISAIIMHPVIMFLKRKLFS